MKLKKLLHIFIISLSSLFLTSCSSQKSLRDDLVIYCEEQVEDYFFETSLGTEVCIVNLSKEEASAHPRVILTVDIGSGADYESIFYQWLQLSPTERKAELRECADLVIQYAQNKKWENNYYLYVELITTYNFSSIVYNYETDEIWIPKFESDFIEMYEKFNTFTKNNLETTQEGIDFLLEKNWAHIKHNQVEYYPMTAYTVYIDEDGKFSAYGQENSIKY